MSFLTGIRYGCTWRLTGYRNRFQGNKTATRNQVYILCSILVFMMSFMQFISLGQCEVAFTVEELYIHI